MSSAQRADAATERLWSLTEDALVEDGPDDRALTVVSRWGERHLVDVDPVVVESLRRMAFGPVALRNALPRTGPPAAETVAAVRRTLDELAGVVVHSLALDDGLGPLLSVVPVTPGPRFRLAPVPGDRRLRLALTATLRPSPAGLLLEAARSEFDVVALRPAARTLLAALAEATTLARLAVETDLPERVVADLVSFLVAVGAVVVAGPDGRFADDAPPGDWSLSELQFHRHTRALAAEPGREGEEHDAPASPVLRPEPAGRRFPLPPADLTAADPTLTDVLEQDQPDPGPSDVLLTAEQLGNLLYRSVRVRSIGPTSAPLHGGVTYEASQRPYLSLARLYELEVYLAVGRCAGLPPGLYHYDPLGHAVVLFDDDAEHADALLDLGREGTGSPRRPPAVVSVSVRMARTSWLLPGDTYARALVHNGALQQVLHLVGRTVGVRVHPVQVDGSAVDRLLQLRWPDEVSLGECVLVSCHPTLTR